LSERTVVITGGAGFIGSNLARRFFEMGYEVRIIDNFSTGKRENLESIGQPVQLLEGDINDEKVIERALTGAAYVLHEAALPSVPRSIKNPIATNRVNVDGTLSLLSMAKAKGVRRLVFAASSSAYGDTAVLPKTESMNPNPKSPYAVSKYAGELYCRVFSTVFGLETICLRYFNVFGPRQDPNSEYAAVIPRFINSLLNNEAPEIFGDGEQTRDFCYVENVIHANVLAVQARMTRGEVVNIACGERISLNQLVNELNKAIGKDISPRYLSDRQGDVKHSLADLREAKRILGYEPVVKVREGLAATVDWFMKQCR
jgi:UDP-N-acetylglucosamine/UDP-N-acetyl-alpha-D-glucosaminouronate 4-epimerase